MNHRNVSGHGAARRHAASAVRGRSGRMGPVTLDAPVLNPDVSTPPDVAPDGRLLLLAPSSNRVYAGDAARLNAAEITLLAGALGIEASVEPVTVAGVDYLAVAGDDDRLDRVVSEASGAFALFGARDGLLSPTPLERRRLYTDDVVTIQKYQGKTNEQFTRLVLNVTAASTVRPDGVLDGTLRVLDPVCGRGTTLSQAVMYGLDTVGIDIDTKDIELYSSFFTTWLKDHRFKHAAATTPVRREKSVIAKKYEAAFAAEKADYLAGQKQTLTCYAADTLLTSQLVKPGTVDVVVGDLPYGVQHGSRGPRGLVRNPLELLEAALPGWATRLRTGGAMGLAWNTRVAPRARVAEVLESAGLTVLDGPGYDDLRHRVDRAITRDVIVARQD